MSEANPYIDISKLNKAEVFCALFNASQQNRMGILHGDGARDITATEAQAILDLACQQQHRDQPYFDCFRGRMMKVKITDLLDPRLYDRDNGQGACEAALLPLVRALPDATK